MKRYLIILMIVMASTAGCGRKEEPKPQEQPKQAEQAPPKNHVRHKVLSFNLEGLTDKGTKKWDVKGESAEAVSENEVKLDNIVAKAYGEDAEAMITADKGLYDKVRNNVTLKQNVKATIENERGLSMDITDFSGDKGSADTKPGKGRKTKTVITCDGDVQFDYENNRAYFDRNVKVASDDGNIDADKITLYLDPASKRLKEIVAEGNVKISKGENMTYSDKATYVEADKKIILTGRPKLVIYQEGGAEGVFLGSGKK